MLRDKFLVLKHEDIECFLERSEMDQLRSLAEKVDGGRRELGKSVNRYLVVNQDEVWADDVAVLIGRHSNYPPYSSDHLHELQEKFRQLTMNDPTVGTIIHSLNRGTVTLATVMETAIALAEQAKYVRAQMHDMIINQTRPVYVGEGMK